MIPDHPRLITSDWVYWRFHGTAGHAGKYSQGQLRAEARVIREYLGRGLDVFVYFNNDVSGYAIENAFDLRRLVLS